MINEKSVFIVPENVEVTTVDGDTVLLNFETGDFYGIGSVGTEVFSMLKESHDFGAIVKKIQSGYDVLEGTLRTDLVALFNELQKNGLVEKNHG